MQDIYNQDVTLQASQEFKQNLQALHNACGKGDLEKVKLLILLKETINARDTNGLTPLHAAIAGQNNKEIICLLLDNGAEINAENDDDITPLQQAVIKNNVETIRLLLDRGAYIDALSANCWTPLHWAVSFNRLAALKVLLCHSTIPDSWQAAQKPPQGLTLKDKCLNLIAYRELNQIGLRLLPNELKHKIEKARRLAYIKYVITLQDNSNMSVVDKAEYIGHPEISTLIMHILAANTLDDLKNLSICPNLKEIDEQCSSI